MRASEAFGVSKETVRDKQVKEAREEMMHEALSPFYDPALRNRVSKVSTASVQVLDEITPDELLEAGFDEAVPE